MPKKHEGDAISIEAGRRIAKERTARKWTQKQLAEATGWNEQDAANDCAKGFSPSRIGNYEQGTRRMSLEEAELFGEVFSLPAAYFLCAVDETEARILHAIRSAPKQITSAFTAR